MNERIMQLLAGVELFSELDHEDLAKVAALAQVRTAPKDTAIFHEGDPA